MSSPDRSIAFAKPFKAPSGSVIRELFPYLSQPGMISLAGGYPSPELLDVEGLREANERAWTDPSAALQYGATEGLPRLRTALQALSASRGVRCYVGDLLVTTGSQQGFDLLVKVLIEPGDVVYVETPSYPATIQALRLAQAEIVQIPVDDGGLVVDRLEEMLVDTPKARRPKFLYTVPNFSNPCGTLLAAERRARLVSLAEHFGFLIVEDDPYGELNFSVSAPGTLFATAQDCLSHDRNPVVYLSSLSKTVAPALRIGWMIAPADVTRRCVIAKQTADLCTSPFLQTLAAEYLSSGRYPSSVNSMRREFGSRARRMVDELRCHLGEDADFIEPLGGMFLWLRTPARVDSQRLFAAAVEAGVLFVPGSAFYANSPDLNTLRLSYAATGATGIAQAVARLANAYHEASR